MHPRKLRPLAPLAALALVLGFAPHSAPAAADPPAQAYQVEIAAPASVKAAVERSLDLIRWQSYAEITPEFFDLLVADARSQARDAAAAQGYFSAQVTSEIDRSTNPATVRLRIDPGEATTVTSIDLNVVGDAALGGPDGKALVARMQTGWSLPKGTIFRQADWTAAKTAAVRVLVADRYAAAKLVASRADIDPETRGASLSVQIDSGPPFRFGMLDVTGLEKYSESMVRNLLTFAPGDPYTAEALQTFLRRLNGSGYFASAQATIETEPARADAAPVHLRVIEAPEKKISAGAGFSTDTLFRAQLSYDNFNIDHNGLRFHADLDAESKVQSATLRLTLPPHVPQYTDTFSTGVATTDIEGLRTKEFTTGWRRKSAAERDQTSYGVAFYVAREMPANADSFDAHSLFFEYARIWRRVDDLLSPSRGYAVNAQIGAAPPGVSTAALGRGIVQTAAWLPVDAKTQLLFKAEAGAVAVRDSRDVPIALLFRIGGDTTVRGYAYESLGPRLGDATVGGRYYVLGSAEVVRWIAEAWGIAAFIDAGNAADRASDLKPVYGYGVGARVRTPIGPFRLDVAYGEATHQVRLHLSVGLSF
ncbi:MAG TPA: BamA/TamA family outer membrane protein [Casimicrobiaceae bacterium]|jgi:translocation and assembly module TamA